VGKHQDGGQLHTGFVVDSRRLKEKVSSFIGEEKGNRLVKIYDKGLERPGAGEMSYEGGPFERSVGDKRGFRDLSVKRRSGWPDRSRTQWQGERVPKRTTNCYQSSGMNGFHQKRQCRKEEGRDSVEGKETLKKPADRNRGNKFIMGEKGEGVRKPEKN